MENFGDLQSLGTLQFVVFGGGGGGTISLTDDAGTTTLTDDAGTNTLTPG